MARRLLGALVLAALASAHLQPEQIHLAFAGQDAAGYPSGMTVAWFTRDKPKDVSVQYGLSAEKLDLTASGGLKKYMANAGFHAHAELPSLKASTKYFYRVGSAGDSKWSEIFSFTTVAADNKTGFSLAVFGDMGWEDSNQRPMWITLHGLEKKWSATLSRATLEKWKDDKSIDFIWHVGDIGYMDDSFAHSPLRFTYEESYNGYMNWLQNLTSTMPYMVSPGNHESECHSPACLLDPFLGRSLMNFTAFNHRWHMPSKTSGGRANMWYSFNVGPVHFVSINTETDFPGAEETLTGDGHFCWLKAGQFGADGEYLRWLEEDLKEAVAARNSGLRPWIIAGGHRPLKNIKQSGVSELFEKYGDDLYFAGHAHMYWRDPPVQAGKATSNEMRVYKDVEGFIQVVAGGAGCDEMPYKVAPKCPETTGDDICVPPKGEEEKSVEGLPDPVFATDVMALGLLDVVNASTLRFRLVDAAHNQTLDEMWVTKTAKELSHATLI